MLKKFAKAFWLLSFLVVTAVLLFVYASLPETVKISNQQSITFTKNTAFYFSLGTLLLINVLVLIVDRFFNSSHYFFKVWFYILITIINGFFIVAFEFMNQFNSLEKFNLQIIGLIIYFGFALIILWASVFPVVLLTKKLKMGNF